jgi:hypothetical protein
MANLLNMRYSFSLSPGGEGWGEGERIYTVARRFHLVCAAARPISYNDGFLGNFAYGKRVPR